VIDFVGKTREEIEAIITAAEAELERRTQVWELRERFDWQVREFERLAALQGPIPATPIPEGGFMPGAIVHVDGNLYLNGSGAFITYAPGEEPISEWVAVDEPPEPGEPDTPPSPVHEPWVQPHAGAEYEPGAIVSHEGRVWRNDHTGLNGWEPGTPGSQWTDLGPIEEYELEGEGDSHD